MNEDRRIPASKETIEGLKANMLLTLESSYHELYKDMAMMRALAEGKLDDVAGLDKHYIEKIIRLHANVCYANMCLCAQCRASFKSEANVEKQYNIRRSVVTAHEMYKYLYGFTGKQTLWLEIEPQLRAQYSLECDIIDQAANDYLTNYAQEADGTLRNVAKHYSNNPEEFFRNMETVSERSVTDRIAALMAFLQPIHQLLVKELESGFGKLYQQIMQMPMPLQRLEVVGTGTQEKVDAIQKGIKHYAGIVDWMMAKIAAAEKLCKEKGFDLVGSTQWNELIENNIGLHILFINIDAMITFRAFTWSETFAEQRQNLAYLIVSVHEGFKKLYGFDENKRQGTFWSRAIKDPILRSGDEQLKAQMVALDARLEELARSAILKDEDMIDAFTHNGTMKNGREYAFAVLYYFVQKIKKDEIDDLPKFLVLMKDVMQLNLAVMAMEQKQSRAESDAMFQRYIDKLDEYKEKACQRATDTNTRHQIHETFEQMKAMTMSLMHLMNGGKMDVVDEIQINSRKDIHTKQDLFKKLCSLNYLNALVKKKEYKDRVGYGAIKSTVIWTVKTLMKNGLEGLCEELSIDPDEDCLFVRCYGLQFSFHHINSKMLTEEWPQLCDKEAKWDGVRLQPIAEDLYELAKDAVEQGMGEDDVRARITVIRQKAEK